MAIDRGERRSVTAKRRDDALQQLDWCIGYLHGIRKVKISKALARNRSVIRTQLMRRSQQPLPAADTFGGVTSSFRCCRSPAALTAHREPPPDRPPAQPGSASHCRAFHVRPGARERRARVPQYGGGRKIGGAQDGDKACSLPGVSAPTADASSRV